MFFFLFFPLLLSVVEISLGLECREANMTEYHLNNPNPEDVFRPFDPKKKKNDPTLWIMRDFVEKTTENLWVYHIDEQVKNDNHVMKEVQYAINILRTELTDCVHMIERTTELSYVNFTFGSTHGCSSHVGKLGGSQIINLKGHREAENRGCGNIGTVHEIMHSLGVHHTHARPDRDSALDIFPNNIRRGQKKNFNLEHISTYGTLFDFESIMLYNSFAFSKKTDESSPTMTKKDGTTFQSNRKYIPLSDVDFIRRMYKCSPILGVPNKSAFQKPNTQEYINKSSEHHPIAKTKKSNVVKIFFKPPVQKKELKTNDVLRQMSFSNALSPEQSQEKCAKMAIRLGSPSFNWSRLGCSINKAYQDNTDNLLVDNDKFFYFEIQDSFRKYGL